MEYPLRLSIIIVNWNVKELLTECLASIARETEIPDDQYEVLVIDNASQDGSVETIRNAFPEVRLIANENNLGFGAGCNVGYSQSRGKTIMLLNPDTEIRHRGIDTMLAKFEETTDAGIMGFRLMNKDGSFQRASGGALPSLGNMAWNYMFFNKILPTPWAPAPLYLEGDPEGTCDVGWVSGASMFVRREAVGDTIFDESFFIFGEDMDVCDRVRSGGWKVLYSSDVSVFHYHGSSYEKQSSTEVMEMAIKGPRLFFKKHHSKMAVVFYDLILLVAYLVRWPLYGILSLVRSDKGYGSLSAFSRKYVRVMFRLLCE